MGGAGAEERAVLLSIQISIQESNRLPYTSVMSTPDGGITEGSATAGAERDSAPQKRSGRRTKRKPPEEKRGPEPSSSAEAAAGEDAPENEARRAKLLALKRALENGTYRVEPEKVAQALIKELRARRE